MRGTKPFPNSLCKRSASAGLRTEPNTRNPFETSTFVVPQPIPVETPVTTTSLLFAIAFSPKMITVHLQHVQRTYWPATCQGVQCSVCRIHRKQTVERSFQQRLRNWSKGVSGTYLSGTLLLLSTSLPMRSTVTCRIAGHLKLP